MSAASCTCRIPGYSIGAWTVCRINPTADQIQTAKIRVWEKRLAHDRATVSREQFWGSPDRKAHGELMGELAEVCWCEQFGDPQLPIQHEGPFKREPDTLSGLGIRWTSTDYLLFKSPQYPDAKTGVLKDRRRDQLDPLDEPEIMSRGDESEIRYYGWMTMREVSPTYQRSGRYWHEIYQTWAVPVAALHRLPPPRAEGRHIWRLHRTLTPTERARGNADYFAVRPTP